MTMKTTRGLAGILAMTALLFTLPSVSTAQYWDYNSYRGSFYDPYARDWYYDSYNSPAGRYPGTQGWRYKSDWELKEDVESQLTWSPFVDADAINVSVKDGKVTLKGTVEDQSSVHDAIENAYEAGAKNVISKLKTEEDE